METIKDIELQIRAARAEYELARDRAETLRAARALRAWRLLEWELGTLRVERSLAARRTAGPVQSTRT